MAVKPTVSPFKFGFYAGLGFMCAQLFLGILVMICWFLFGLGIFALLTGNARSKLQRNNSTMMNSQTDQTPVYPADNPIETGRQ